MYEFYKMRQSDEILKRSRKDLKQLYSQIPETEGCKENIAKEGGCGAWCCENQQPEVMYAEFLNTWNYVLNNYSAAKVASLLLKAVRLYLDAKPTSGCIFWDKKTKLCTQHQTRPMNCRTYAQMPDEDFKPRYEKLKILYAKMPTAVIKEQCNLCTTVGKKPTKEDTDAWQVYLEQIEESVGIEKKNIHDGEGGSYRTYPDHILLRLASPAFLAELTSVRVSGTKYQREEYIRSLHKRLKTQHPALEDTIDEDAGKSIIIIGNEPAKSEPAQSNSPISIISP